MAKLLQELVLPDDLDAEERLESLTDAIVSCAQAAFPPRNKQHKDGWSPAVRETTIALEKIKLIKRHVFGHKGYSKWTPASFGKGMHEVLRCWRRDVKRLHGDRPEDEIPDLGLPFPLESWRLRTLPETAEIIETVYVGP